MLPDRGTWFSPLFVHCAREHAHLRDPFNSLNRCPSPSVVCNRLLSPPSAELGRVSVRWVVEGSCRLCATDQDLVDGNVDCSSERDVSDVSKTRGSREVVYLNSEYLLSLTKYPMAP